MTADDRTYEAPAVTDLGTLAELTLAGENTGADLVIAGGTQSPASI